MCGQPSGRGFEFVLELAGILYLETEDLIKGTHTFESRVWKLF